ncbi:unnamed protein product [Moneuplotes crassus]|uniref:Uncharacterized protein n=1 Tax=Euplotes crassus TaxID=5936 RepID=A0AAD1XRJ6_EUPCR|nr:unnamed protein product [Moneuplotes crassus]
MSAGFFEVDDNEVQKDKPKFNDGEKKKQKMFTPVTLKLFMTASVDSEDNFNVDNQEINDVILVGRLYERDDQPTRVSYLLNDNTGTMKVTFYKGGNYLPKYLEEFKYEEGCYVKVFGQAKNFKDVRQVVGVHLEAIDDFNYITNHLLQVFVASCVRKKGVLSSQDITEANNVKGEMNEKDKTQFVKTEATKIINENSARGVSNVSRDVIFNKVKSSVTHPEFQKIIQHLLDEMELFEDENGALGAM